MCKITMSDIRNRQYGLNSGTSSSCQINIESVYNTLPKHYTYDNAKLILNNWQYLSENTNIAFSKVMDVFELVCENDNTSNIRNAALLISEGILHKVRDGAQAQKCMNIKMGKFKIPANKIPRTIKKAAAAPMQADILAGASSAPIIQPNAKSNNKEETVEECFKILSDTCYLYEQCDRILSNHSKLSKRYDIDKIVREAVYSDDLDDCIYELCSYIDTYNTQVGIKYNTALENIKYCLDKNCMPYNNKDIVNRVTDYFLINNEVTDSLLHDMRYIIDNNKIFNKDDCSDIGFIYTKVNTSFGESFMRSENDIFQSFMEEAKEKKNPIKNLIDNFKLLPSKSIEALKKLVSRIYTNSPENIIEEVPNLFSIIRLFLVGGAFAINPIVGILGLCTDYVVKLNLSRKEMMRVIAKYEKEKKNIKSKLDKASTDEQKKRYKDYLKKIESDIEKLTEYEDNLYSDQENEDRHMNDDSDFDFTFDEDCKLDGEDLMNATNIMLMSKLVDALKDWDCDGVSNSIASNINKLPEDAIDNITDLAILQPSIIDRKTLMNSMVYDRGIVRKLDGISKYERIDCYNDNIRKLEAATDVSIDPVDDFDTVYESTLSLVNACDSITDLLSEINTEFVYEATEKKSKEKEPAPSSNKKGLSFINKLKLSIEEMKRGFQGLSDKEKQISRNIDSTVNTLQKKAEESLKNDNREAVIKGSILPSASKLIKTAIISGAACLINPAIAAIGLITNIALSAKNKTKERQLILDDIEIELQMCEKYLRLAEEKGDMKATRTILQTQRTLQRQKQRLKYNMAVHFGEKAPKEPAANTES